MIKKEKFSLQKIFKFIFITVYFRTTEKIIFYLSYSFNFVQKVISEVFLKKQNICDRK